MNICISITKSLCCMPETNTTLLISYTPNIKKKKIFFFFFLQAVHQSSIHMQLPLKRPTSEESLMGDALSGPFNKPLILSWRTRRENGSQIANKERNLLKCHVQEIITPCSALQCVCVCVCVCVCMHMRKCVDLPVSLPIVVSRIKFKTAQTSEAG